ncbi:uncharacterized protein LOC115238182 isoform X3 [Formica exsecta]|uniref:uncharacterized protein LOC115238182 isoform X3 n=1 Tax=Formica exsecta TaxID=72781 RepID=UPI001144A0BA|nr:uncharacterized protein LOC115238182 isoform X3 [Formica exsecta]
MRRACSLSDLSINPSNKLLHGPVQVSGKLGSKNISTTSRTVSGSANLNSQSKHASGKTHITRSSSVGVLNQSDSESDAGIAGGNSRGWSSQTSNNRMTGIMRPTISSQNKINHQNKSSSSGSTVSSILRRRGMQGAFSTINLSQVGNQEDSSSEDTSSNGNGGKPALPPRPRSISIDHSSASLSLPSATMRRSGSTITSNGRGSASVIEQNGSKISATNRNQLEPSPHELPVKDTDRTIDVASAELGMDKTLVSTQLCNTIADELMRTADNVVQLYKRLTIDNDDDSSTEAIDRDTMLRGLESSVNETMRTLRLVIAGNESHNDGSSKSIITNEATAKFQELLAGQDQGKDFPCPFLARDTTMSLDSNL